MAKRRNPISPGDVYIAQVPDGRFGAIRVLQSKERHHLIYTCDYLDASSPALTDVALRRCLVRNRFSWKGEPALWWVRGNLPKGLTSIGVLPLNTAEAAMTSPSHGFWDLSCAHEAWLDWRWIHDRPTFEREREIERAREAEEARLRALAQKPKQMIEGGRLLGDHRPAQLEPHR